jgi:hypothetical protein
LSCLFLISSFLEHKHSGYSLTWHYNYGKGRFNSGKLYKVARSIIASNKPGSCCISHILRLLGKHLGVNNEEFAGKYTQDFDMVNQVAAVKAAVASKTPLSTFDNPQMKEYFRKLDPIHSPPYCIKRTCILEVMMVAAMKELVQMLTKRREQLHEGFVPGTIDFWTVPHRHEQYRSFVIDFPAEKYVLEDGMTLFMSKKTKEGMPDGSLLTGKFNNTNVQLWSANQCHVNQHHNFKTAMLTCITSRGEVDA